MSSRPVAAVDIGTNSVRLLITGAGVRLATVTGLGRGLSSSGRLNPDGRTATLEVLSRYRRLMDEAGVVAVRAVATSASRDAVDGHEFAAEMAAVLGFEPEVIGGEEEAALSFTGATAGLPGADWVVVDIGGGSTEVISGDWGRSFDVGSVRVADRYLPGRPASGGDVATARGWVAEEMAVASVVTGRPVVGVAGTWTSLAALDLELEPYSDEAVHHVSLTRHVLETWVDRLAGLSVAETERLAGLDPARAPVILGGAVVAAVSLEVLGAGEVLISSQDLLDGVVAGL